MLKSTILFCVLFLTPVDGKFGFKGLGRSSSSSSSRSNSGFRPQQNNGFRPQQNQGFQPAPAPGWHPNVHQQNPGNRFSQPGGFSPNRNFGGVSQFGKGTGVGSVSRGSTFKSALAGAAIGTIGGFAAWELGKAIIHSASSPFHYGNRDYFWGSEYYRPKNGEVMCSMPLDQLIALNAAQQPSTTTLAPGVTTDPNPSTTTPSPNQVLSTLQFQNGTRPKQIVWGCPQSTPVCCGTECCPGNTQNFGNSNRSSGIGNNIAAVVIIILLVIGILACCCCFVVYKLCRTTIQSFLPSGNNGQEQGYNDNTGKYGDGQQPYGQSYPMQPYPNQYNNQAYSDPPAYPAPYPEHPNYGPPRY